MWFVMMFGTFTVNQGGLQQSLFSNVRSLLFLVSPLSSERITFFTVKINSRSTVERVMNPRPLSYVVPGTNHHKLQFRYHIGTRYAEGSASEPTPTVNYVKFESVHIVQHNLKSPPPTRVPMQRMRSQIGYP